MSKNINKNKLYFIIFILAIYSCRHSSKNDTFLEKVTYYQDNEPKEVFHYIIKNKDTIFSGEYYRYYPNGKVELYTNYKNGLENGKSYSLYSNGNVKYKTFIVNGKQEGNRIDYDSLGNIYSRGFYKSDNLILDRKIYYQNGKIKIYAFRDLSGNLRYRSTYDTTGSLINEKGSLNSIYYFDPNNRNYFSISDTLKEKIIAPEPPHLKIEFYRYGSNKKGQRFNKQTIKEVNHRYYLTRIIHLSIYVLIFSSY